MDAKSVSVTVFMSKTDINNLRGHCTKKMKKKKKMEKNRTGHGQAQQEELMPRTSTRI